MVERQRLIRLRQLLLRRGNKSKFSVEEQDRRSARAAWRRRTAVTVAAVTAAWLIGSLFNSTDAIVASILVLITLRVSLHASMNEALGQLAGVGLGVGVAYTTNETLGVGMLSVAVMVGSALAISQLLQLGDEGAANIAITSLIVLGPGTAVAGNALDRFWGSLIGVSIAVVASYFVQSSTPVKRTLEKVAALLNDSARLLNEMSAGLNGGYTPEDASGWLGAARQNVSSIPNLRSQSFEAVRYARWSPLARVSDAEAAHLRHLEAEHVAVQIRTIARTMYDMTEKHIVLPHPVAHPVAKAMNGTAKLILSSSALVMSNPTQQIDRTQTAPLRWQLINVGAELVRIEHPSAITVTGALLSNIERIVDTVEGTSGALTEVAVITSDADIAERLVEAVTKPVRETVRLVSRKDQHEDDLTSEVNTEPATKAVSRAKKVVNTQKSSPTKPATKGKSVVTKVNSSASKKVSENLKPPTRTVGKSSRSKSNTGPNEK